MEPEYSDVPFDGPPRSYSTSQYDKRYIAIHNTSNDATAEAEANYAQTRTDSVSSHYYVDNNSIVQSLRTQYGANHAGSSTGNHHAIAYEITGTNDKTRNWWLDNVDWELLSRQIARDCQKHAIDVRTLTVAQMQDGHSTGIVTHDQMRLAWGGTTHTDPGPNFPMDHLIQMIKGGGTVSAADENRTYYIGERVNRLRQMVEVYDIKPFTASDGSTFVGQTGEENELAQALNAMKADITQMKADIATILAAVQAGGGSDGTPPAVGGSFTLSGTITGSGTVA